jgi:hypothetical protein
MKSRTLSLQRRPSLQLGSLPAFSAFGVGGAPLAGCRPADTPAAPFAPFAPTPPSAAPHRYAKTHLVANRAGYHAKFVQAGCVNAWGIAIRPAGAGGHFWVKAGGTSWQYLGDVQKSSDAAMRALFQDGLKKVAVPGADVLVTETSAGKITGVVYSSAELNSANFRVAGQSAGNTTFDGSARFAVVTDSGKVSAWTDRSITGSIARVDGAAA